MKDDLGFNHKNIEDEGDICEVCGNYTDDLKNVNGSKMCEECEETTTVV